MLRNTWVGGWGGCYQVEELGPKRMFHRLSLTCQLHLVPCKLFLFGGRAQRCFALQDTPKSPQDCLPSTIAFHTFAPLQCRLWQVLIYFMAWASMLPRPLVRGPPLQPCLFLCFLAVVLRFGFSCSGFLPGFFKKGAKKVSVADDRLDYYMVRADPASPGTIPCPRRSRSMPALLE